MKPGTGEVRSLGFPAKPVNPLAAPDIRPDPIKSKGVPSTGTHPDALWQSTGLNDTTASPGTFLPTIHRTNTPASFTASPAIHHQCRTHHCTRYHCPGSEASLSVGPQYSKWKRAGVSPPSEATLLVSLLTPLGKPTWCTRGADFAIQTSLSYDGTQ